jgi:hypothetical protein
MRLRVLLSIVAIFSAASSGRNLSTPEHDARDGVALEALSISGPAAVAPGHAATFTATGRMRDGTTRDYTDRASWRSSNATVLCVSAHGAAIGATSGDARISASAGGVTGTSNVLVTPAGTFRLSGMVSESGRPIAGATVAVMAGPGLGMSTVTNGAGEYLLYGVGGSVELQATKRGYVPAMRVVTLTRSGVVDFPDLTRESRPDDRTPRD